MRRRQQGAVRSALRVAAILAAAMAVLGAAACGGDDEAGQGRLRMGVVAIGAADEVKRQYDTTAADLAAALGDGRSVEVVTSTEYFAIAEGLRTGDLDFGVLGSLSYALAVERAPIEAVAVGVDETGAPGYHSYLITNAPDEIRSPADLRGHSLALASKLSTSGYLFPISALDEAGLSLGDMRVASGGKHAANILAVKQGSVDAAFVDSIEYETAAKKGLIDRDAVPVVWRSERITGSPFVMRSDLDGGLKRDLRAALLGLKGTPESPLGLEKSMRLVPVDDSTYDPIRRLARKAGITIADFGD